MVDFPFQLPGNLLGKDLCCSFGLNKFILSSSRQTIHATQAWDLRHRSRSCFHNSLSLSLLSISSISKALSFSEIIFWLRNFTALCTSLPKSSLPNSLKYLSLIQYDTAFFPPNHSSELPGPLLTFIGAMSSANTITTAVKLEQP